MTELHSIFAPAKINLFLHITGKRADGYHTLQSLMAFVSAGDRLSFSAAKELSLEVQGPFASSLASPQDNLVYKAARLLAEKHGISPDVKITLTKNLPVASGLGGGSSDAAAALKGLTKFWKLQEDLLGIERIALELGADVPACIGAHSVFAEGIGEVLKGVTMPSLYLLLVNPLVPTPTAEVFRKFSGGFMPPVEKKASYALPDIIAGRNNLTAAAIAVTPAIAEVLAALAGTPDCQLARVSGSGATCFGIYPDEKSVSRAAAILKKVYPEWWVVPTQTFGQSLN